MSNDATPPQWVQRCPVANTHVAVVRPRITAGVRPGIKLFRSRGRNAETIAAYVSRGNECRYCCETHAAAARVHLGKQRDIVDQVLADAASAPVMSEHERKLAMYWQTDYSRIPRRLEALILKHRAEQEVKRA